MGKLNISPDLFLEQQELNRLQKFMQEDGYLDLFKRQTGTYGILRTKQDTSFANFRVEVGTNTQRVAINTDSYAFDADGNVIVKTAEDNIALPLADQWYWMYVSYAESPVEVGTVNIASNGTLTGTNTLFTEVLRGYPNRQAKISFPNSIVNTSEYLVQEVTDDTNALISGILTAETDAEYRVVGTFTPGVVPTEAEKYPFRYDSATITFFAETITNTPPALDNDRQFILARVRLNGTTIEIQDNRTQIFQTKDEFFAQTPMNETNALAGIDSIRWNVSESTKDENLVQFSWGFVSSNLTVDFNLRLLTVSGGDGGIFKDTDDFTNGDFDGWRVYASRTGSFARVVQSTKSGSQINLLLDNALADDFSTVGTIYIVPDADEIEIWALPDNTDTHDHLDKKTMHNIANARALISLVVPSRTSYKYTFSYRYKTGSKYSIWRQINSDAVGYYTEASFNDDGTLKDPIDRVRQPYTANVDLSGNITLTAHPNHYATFTYNIDLGDLLRVQNKVLTFLDTQIDLQVGLASQVQYITGTITLANDLIFNLSPTDARSGNRFVLIFDANITLSGNRVSIYNDFGGGGQLLKTLSDTEIDYQKYTGQKVVVECFYNGSVWIATTVETDAAQLYDIKAKMQVPVNAFDGTGLGQVDGYYGWALCNGNNGTPNLAGRMLIGQDSSDSAINTVGKTGGETQKTLAEANLPPHTHDSGGMTTDDDSHAHKIYLRDSGTAVGKHRDAEFGRGGDDQLGESLRTGGTHTDTHTHSHNVNGNTGDGGFANTPFDNRPNFYTVAWIARVPKA